MFLAGDIGPQKLPLKSSKIDSFWDTIFVWEDTQKIFAVFYCRMIHVTLKFQKDPFRGLNGIDYNKSNIYKTDTIAV